MQLRMQESPSYGCNACMRDRVKIWAWCKTPQLGRRDSMATYHVAGTPWRPTHFGHRSPHACTISSCMHRSPPMRACTDLPPPMHTMQLPLLGRPECMATSLVVGRAWRPLWSLGLHDDLFEGILVQLNDLSFTEDEYTLIVTSLPSDQITELGWESWLVGKFMSETPVDGAALRRIFRAIWKSENIEEIVELRPKFFHIKLRSAEAKDDILRGGPWLFNNVWFSMLSFDRLSCPEDYAFSQLEIWIRIYQVPLGLMTKAMAISLDGSMGTVIAVDTRSLEYGEWMRVPPPKYVGPSPVKRGNEEVESVVPNEKNGLSPLSLTESGQFVESTGTDVVVETHLAENMSDKTLVLENTEYSNTPVTMVKTGKDGPHIITNRLSKRGLQGKYEVNNLILPKRTRILHAPTNDAGMSNSKNSMAAVETQPRRDQ
ncbi:hypothetical protein F3Y22_tig00110411pilonHSYRG00022 [Hibiscus syriacus]|uniref:DUF4283 domain-containing protein n=1 Tax=Hibiscus syriacus TaxID=106335 RepID=A0A6A3AQ91_HIBSY|nr:hypothetical protein F3Y22_tig00110411pilonHSYRG00022 [Hibiscus syriacus]